MDDLVRAATQSFTQIWRESFYRGLRSLAVTAALGRWTREVSPGLSRGECLELLLSANHEGGGGGGSAGNADDASVARVDDNGGSSTEWQREAGVKILRALRRRASIHGGIEANPKQLQARMRPPHGRCLPKQK